MTKVVLSKWLAVTFDKPEGFRDVYWCHSVNEPFIIEYGMPTLVDGKPKPHTMCPLCRCTQVDMENSGHIFLCHIQKEPQNGNQET